MPVSITKEQVVAAAGEFADPRLTDDQWTLVLARTVLEVGTSGWAAQEYADMAARYYAAHLASKLPAAGVAGGGASMPAGPVSQVTVGPVSKSYDTSGSSMKSWSQAADDLRTTAYGREFLRLARLYVTHAFAV